MESIGLLIVYWSESMSKSTGNNKNKNNPNVQEPVKKENLHAGHRQRLRNRARMQGIKTFDLHQIVELLLFYSIPRKDTSETAHRLVNQFGGIGGILNAPESELCKIHGIGKKSAQWLRALGGIANAYGEVLKQGLPKLKNVRSAMEFCEKCRERLSAPCVCQLCTTPAGKILRFTQVSKSADWGDPAVLRQALRDALAMRARNILFIVLLEEDNPQIGDYEKKYAHKYAYTTGATGAELLDIILVGRESMVSMYRDGYLNRKTYGGARSILAAKYLREDLDDDDEEENDDDELPQSEACPDVPEEEQ